MEAQSQKAPTRPDHQQASSHPCFLPDPPPRLLQRTPRTLFQSPAAKGLQLLGCCTCCLATPPPFGPCIQPFSCRGETRLPPCKQEGLLKSPFLRGSCFTPSYART